MNHLGERPRWSMQNLSKGRKKGKVIEEREIRSCLLILDLKEVKLKDSGKEGKAFYKWHVLKMNDDLYDKVVE